MNLRKCNIALLCLHVYSSYAYSQELIKSLWGYYCLLRERVSSHCEKQRENQSKKRDFMTLIALVNAWKSYKRRRFLATTLSACDQWMVQPSLTVNITWNQSSNSCWLSLRVYEWQTMYTQSFLFQKTQMNVLCVISSWPPSSPGVSAVLQAWCEKWRGEGGLRGRQSRVPVLISQLG